MCFFKDTHDPERDNPRVEDGRMDFKGNKISSVKVGA